MINVNQASKWQKTTNANGTSKISRYEQDIYFPGWFYRKSLLSVLHIKGLQFANSVIIGRRLRSDRSAGGALSRKRFGHFQDWVETSSLAYSYSISPAKLRSRSNTQNCLRNHTGILVRQMAYDLELLTVSSIRDFITQPSRAGLEPMMHYCSMKNIWRGTIGSHRILVHFRAILRKGGVRLKTVRTYGHLFDLAS